MDYIVILDFLKPYFMFLVGILIMALVAFVLYVLWFFIKYRLFIPTLDKLERLTIKPKYYDLMRWLLFDLLNRKNVKNDFDEYGFTCYVGRQGAGKTMSMVEYLQRMRKRYPDCLIVTNFKCSIANFYMDDWRSLMNIRNGTKGVIFAIDEIHSEYSSDSWKDFPESLLSEISQQRKQRVKIVATSQRFSRVVKQIREQAFSVVQCSTVLNRFTVCREYDADDYMAIDTAKDAKKKLSPLRKYTFVQSNSLRSCYDTYAKIERMSKAAFIPREKR